LHVAQSDEDLPFFGGRGRVLAENSAPIVPENATVIVRNKSAAADLQIGKTGV